MLALTTWSQNLPQEQLQMMKTADISLMTSQWKKQRFWKWKIWQLKSEFKYNKSKLNENVIFVKTMIWITNNTELIIYYRTYLLLKKCLSIKINYLKVTCTFCFSSHYNIIILTKMFAVRRGDILGGRDQDLNFQFW